MKKHAILLALSDEDSQYPLAIKLALEKKGYEVTILPRHDSAMKTIQAKHFDLVITDLLVVLERVKQLHPETMGILVLATRDKGGPVVRTTGSCPDDYLFKPLELEEMEMCVNYCFIRLERLRRDFQIERCEPSANEEVIKMTKAVLHDIRGSLISFSATLKLLSRGYYGKMDEQVMNRIRELFSKITGLIGITDGSPQGDDYRARSEQDLSQAVINPKKLLEGDPNVSISPHRP